VKGEIGLSWTVWITLLVLLEIVVFVVYVFGNGPALSPLGVALFWIPLLSVAPLIPMVERSYQLWYGAICCVLVFLTLFVWR
jgi:hypothetical protein